MTPSDKRLEVGMEDMGLSQSQPCGASKHAATDLGELMEIARAATPGDWFHRQAGQTSPQGEEYDWIADAERAHGKILVGRGALYGGSKDYAFIATFNPARVISLLERLQAAEQDAANRLADVEALEESAREDAAALTTSEASRLSVEGERDDTLGLLAMMRDQLTMAQGERAALERAREIIAEIDEYQKRPERGDPDHECACCMGELLDDHRAVIAQIDEALSLPVGAGGKDSSVSQDPGPHPCGEQPGADVAATAALADKGHVIYRGWTIDFDPPPIPTRNCDWHFCHEDFDGSDDRDNRYGHAASLDDAKAEIDDWHKEHAHGDA